MSCLPPLPSTVSNCMIVCGENTSDTLLQRFRRKRILYIRLAACSHSLPHWMPGNVTGLTGQAAPPPSLTTPCLSSWNLSLGKGRRHPLSQNGAMSYIWFIQKRICYVSIEGLDLSLCLFFSERQGIANKGDERDVTKCHMLIIGQKLDICFYFCSFTLPYFLQVLSQKYGASSFGKKESQNENDPLQHACLPLLPWKPPTLLIPCLGYWHYHWLSLELEGYSWSPQLDSHTFSFSHLSHLPLTSLYLSISLQLGPIAQPIGNL